VDGRRLRDVDGERGLRLGRDMEGVLQRGEVGRMIVDVIRPA
jgi:hypothetical protein